MKFIVHWSQTHATFRAGIERFKETGALPPEGVTLLGRWFGMNGQGFAGGRGCRGRRGHQRPLLNNSLCAGAGGRRGTTVACVTDPEAERPVSGFAIATLVLGIVGIVLPAVICGIVALGQIHSGSHNGRGLAIAGLLITTEAMVAERPKKEAAHAPMPGGGMGGMDY